MDQGHLKRTMLVIGMMGCVASEPSPETAPGIEIVTRDLSIGDKGPDVRAVHQYLMNYGYFPNDTLANAYPNWQPIVEVPPARPDVFDAHTAEAIRRFQANTGASPTGVVDEKTRALLKATRCGNPDGILPLDPSAKYAFSGPRVGNGAGVGTVTGIPSTILTWSLLNTDDGITQAIAGARAATAMTTWTRETMISAIQNPPEPFLRINFGTVLNGSVLYEAVNNGTGGSGVPPAAHITLDAAATWSTVTPTPSGSNDLQATLEHAIGHVLGLGHSTVPGALMYPLISNFTGADRGTTVDDNVAISARYDFYQYLPGTGTDVGSGGDFPASGTGTWMVGTSAVSGGYNIFRRQGTDWVADSTGRGGVRITADANGIPWIVDDANRIFRRTSSDPTSGSWTQIPGAATDIGASAGGVWIVTTTPQGGGFLMSKWDGGTGWIADAGTGGAVRIAVSSNGVPWVVTDAGQIWTRTSADPAAGWWFQIPSPMLGVSSFVNDIGISADSHPFVIRTDGTASTSVFAWNEQTQTWSVMYNGANDSGGASIAVDAHGRPIFTNKNGKVIVSIK